ncbi:SH3 domain-containing protein [Phascolomyces articulosus]|uniref:SH3 domain-containing protein n=1 Tax=Phascolomyces articulosus TaxID=60185 RepID=A0AAD5JML8_9FUNG|nr:SH3 domain-containing protein [Phascolomyces articulosus]
MNKEAAFANHVLASIRKDLDFLKQHQYLSQQQYDEIKRNLPTNAAPSTPTRSVAPSPHNEKILSTAEALYLFDGSNPQDLSFKQGDIIQIHEKVNNDWWRGSCNGKTGLFPSNYVTEKQASSVNNTPPPPPPPATNPPHMPGTPTIQEKGAPSYGGNNGYPPPPPSYNAPPPSYGGAPPAAYPSYSQAPPPPQAQSYAAPPPVQQTYSAPPPQEAPAAASSGGHSSGGLGGKLGGVATHVGSNIANAATWGFGATLGSEAAHNLF